METPKLGRLVEGNPGRDAVHVAIAPVEAGEDLEPGEGVGVADDGKAYNAFAHGIKYLGVVDPFIDECVVRKGQVFWLCLHPGAITSLRHVWSHSAFQVKVPEVANG